MPIYINILHLNSAYFQFDEGHKCQENEKKFFQQMPSLSAALTLSSLNCHCHLHPLQAANCCRNSRLVVDEDDLMWV